MNILLVNDDGIACEGILSLVRALSPQHNLTVVSPESERSGFSHSLTIHTPVTVEKRRLAEFPQVAAYAVSGTPADCVKLGVRVLCGQKPDLLISGINNGENIGTDIAYSGTCNAALEGAMLGVRSIAISLEYAGHAMHYAPCAEFMAGFLEGIGDAAWLVRGILNINYPDADTKKVRGVRLATISDLDYDEGYTLQSEADGKAVYQLYGRLRATQDAGSDEYLLREGYITITPIGYDCLLAGHMDRLREMFQADFA